VAEAVDENKPWPGDYEERHLLGVVPRERVGHNICAARLVLDGEIEAEELANPMVLRNGR
jgi:hypothetical protein